MRRKFLKYVIPSVSAMWIFSLYTMATGIFVANGVSEIALAALSISMPYVNITFAVSVLFSIGASTVASIYLGNKENKKANEIFTMCAVIVGFMSIAATALVLLNIESIAYFLGATSKTIGFVKEYLGILSMFGIFAMLSDYFEVLVKADGHPHLAAVGMGIAAAVNILLVYLFVIRMGIGIKGAALASGLAYAASTLFYISHFMRSGSRLKFVSFKFDFSIIKRVVPLGLSDSITEFSAGFIIFIFNRVILKNIGELGVITYTVIVFVNSFVTMTMAGISQGTQPLISYYYGRDDERAYTYFLKNAIQTTLLVSVVIFAVSTIFAKEIVGVYISKNQVEIFDYAVRSLRMYVPAYLLMGLNYIFAGFYTAIEKPIYSMIVSVGRGLLIITISLYAMTALFGSDGIWMSSFVSEILCLGLSTAIFIKLYYRDLFADGITKKHVFDYD